MSTRERMELSRILTNDHKPEVPSLPGAPQLGVLTQTIAYSPVVKWIFRAQILHAAKSDAIFVREDCVELKQLVRRQLHTIALKNDFDGSIRAACILGKPIEAPEDPEVDYERRFGDAGYTSDGSQMDIDSEPYSDLPPQMLVLIIRSGQSSKLMFIFAQEDGNGHVGFVSSIRPLPSHRSDATRADAHVAVDSRSVLVLSACGSSLIHA